jgi:hypothetical protein
MRARGLLDSVQAISRSVVNHAAYATEMIAECGIPGGDSALAVDAAQTPCLIAKDPRPGVRAAAAYALGSVKGFKDLADSLAWLANDPYVQVRSEWWLGRRAAEQKGIGNAQHRPEAQRTDETNGREQARGQAST